MATPISDSRPSHAGWVLAFLVVMAAAFIRVGESVPWRNEFFYLIRLIETYRPDFVANDWTLQGGAPEHFLFNHLFGALALALPPEPLAWTGRALCWGLNLGLLLAIARQLRLSALGAVVVLVIWMGWGQSLVAGSWMIGTFEAKCISYAALNAAILLLLRNAPRASGLLLGLSFSFHPSVGMFGILAMLPAYLVSGWSRKRLATVLALTLVGTLPGIFAVAPVVFSEHAATADDWRLMTEVKMPHHLDPFTWPKRFLLLLPLLTLFSAAHAWRSDDPGWKRLSYFCAATGIVFAVGVGLRFANAYELLSYFPFRLYPLYAPLLFGFGVADALSKGVRDLPRWAVVVGVLALVTLPDPIAPYIQHAPERLRRTESTSHLTKCYEWLRENTPDDATGIAPPGKDREVWYRARRGLVVCSEFQTYDRLTEWRRRVEELGGPMHTADGRRASLVHHYEALTETEMQALIDRYQPDFIVTRARYSPDLGYEMAFETPEEDVYLPTQRDR